MGWGADHPHCQPRYVTSNPLLIACSTISAVRVSPQTCSRCPEWQAGDLWRPCKKIAAACPLEGLVSQIVYSPESSAFANVPRICLLGKSDSDTSLFANATGISALSYMLHLSSPTSPKISSIWGIPSAIGEPV